MPTYRCSKKGCSFSTEDMEAFVKHALDERLIKELPTAESPKARTHATVADYLNCPECYTKFEKLLLARGWKKPEEKAEKPQKQGLNI